MKAVQSLRRNSKRRAWQAGLQSEKRSLRLSLEPLEGRLMMAADAFLQGTAFYGNSDTPKPDAKIDLYLSPNFTTPFLTTTTNPAGYYRFGGLEPGTYRIVEPAAVSYSSADTQIISDVYKATEISNNTIEVIIPDYELDNSAPGVSELFLTWTAYVQADPAEAAEGANVTLIGAAPPDTFTVGISQLAASLGTGSSGASISDINSNLLTVCADLNALVDLNDPFKVEVKSTKELQNLAEDLTEANRGRIGYLFNHYGGLLLPQNAGGTSPQGSQKAAGLQLAIWELLYDSTDDLDAGIFKVNASPLGPTTTADELAAMKNAANAFLIESAGKSEEALLLDPINKTISGQGMLARNSFNFVNDSHGPVPPTARVEIAHNATNEVGDPHTFTTVVYVDDGYPAGTIGASDSVTGFRLATDEEVTEVTVSLTGSNGANPDPAGLFVSGDNNFGVEFTSTTAGIIKGNATATVTINGVQSPSATTDGSQTSVGSGAFNSVPAIKKFVDANITITPNATNKVGDPHTFTVTVNENAGDGLGFVPAVGESVTVTLTNTNGASAPVTTFAGTTNAAGQILVTTNSSTAGRIIANATSSIVVGGLTLIRDTNAATANIGAGPGGSGPAVKTYVDAKIVLTPKTATNVINDPHVFTAAVWQDDGLTAAQGGDGVTGFAPAPNGTPVSFSLTSSGGATASFVGSSTPTVLGGTASVTINSPTAGTVTLNATTTLAVGGVTLTRDTDPSTTPTAGPEGSGPATKIYVEPKIKIEKTTNGPTNSNTTAPTYHNEDVPTGAGVPILTPGSSVTWTYQVTNTGTVTFDKTAVVVNDDNGTASTGDDFTPVYVSGDVGPGGVGPADNKLSPGEVWIYQASGTVKTLATATGSSATFDFNGSSSTSGSAGNIRSYSAGGMAVKASAWSRVKGPEAPTSWSTAYLGAYSGGLGVTDTSEGDGSNGTHTVDNIGRDNYVLFEFDQMVAIDSAFLGYVVGDSDLRVWIGTKTNPYTSHQSLNDGFLASMGFTEDNLTDLTSARLADLNSGNYVGNVVIIAASPGDDTPEDRFKIQKVTVKATEAGVYANKGTVTATGYPGVTGSDDSHYKNPITPPAPTTGSISGYVYKECDNDACKESGENGIKDVTVKLYNGSGTVVATTKTASDGSYKFTNLPAGTYKLVETQPTSYFDGKEKAGSVGGNISVNDQISNIQLTAGTNAYDYNFAELYGGKLSGYVYKDGDNDGRKDSGERGIEGVKILLTGTDVLGRVINRWVYTDCNGYYEFEDLYAGTYTISEVDPSGYADGKDTLGTLGGTLSNDKFKDIKVGFCDVGLNYNFGERSSSGC